MSKPHKLYYFQGRRTGVAARDIKEARALKRQGGDEVYKIRKPTKAERELMRQGKWVRTRADGKPPGQSIYDSLRGFGPRGNFFSRKD